MPSTKSRLKRQAKRRTKESRRNAGFGARYLDRGIAGLNNLLRDVITYRGRGRRIIPSRRKRAGYTRHTGSGAARTHTRQRMVTPAPATPYRVVLRRDRCWPRDVVATDDQMIAKIGYENAAARFGADRLEAVGFAP